VSLCLCCESAPRYYGHLVLDPLPPNATLLARGDLIHNAVAYLQHCEGVRPDVRLVSVALLKSKWYARKLAHAYPDMQIPSLTKVYRPDCAYPGWSPGCWSFMEMFRLNLGSHRMFVAAGSPMHDVVPQFDAEFRLLGTGMAHEVLTIGAHNALYANSTQFTDWLRSSVPNLPLINRTTLPTSATLGIDRWETNATNTMAVMHGNLAAQGLTEGNKDKHKIEAVQLAIDIMDDWMQFYGHEHTSETSGQMLKARGHAHLLLTDRVLEKRAFHQRQVLYYWGLYLKLGARFSSPAEVQQISKIVKETQAQLG